MVKLTILVAIALWLFLRKVSWSNGTLGQRLQRLSFFVIVGLVSWWGFKAFGPSPQIVYSDSFGKWTVSGKPVLVGWEQFTLFPLEKYAKPVFISQELNRTFPIPAGHQSKVIESYPYPDAAQSWLTQFSFSIGFYLLVVLYFSKSPHIQTRWQRAQTDDTRDSYQAFEQWATDNPVRRLYTWQLRKAAQQGIASIKQRNLLKIDAYLKGWQEKGLNNRFLSLLKTIATADSDKTGVCVRYSGGNITPARGSISPESLFNVLNDQDVRHQELLTLCQQFLQTNPIYQMGTGISMLKHSPAELQFLPPHHTSATPVVTRHLIAKLNQGVKKLANADVFEFVDGNTKNPTNFETLLDVSFDCFVQHPRHVVEHFNHWKKDAVMSAGAGPREYVYRGETRPGGNVTTYQVGMVFKWALLVKGEVKDTGVVTTYPDPKVSRRFGNTSRFDNKADVELEIFEGASLSNIDSLFTQWMGIPLTAVNSRMIKFDKNTIQNYQGQQQKTSELATILEDSLRSSTYEELMKLGAEEIYKMNKDLVDNVIADYVQQMGDADTIAYMIETYGDFMPEITADIISLIAEAVSEE